MAWTEVPTKRNRGSKTYQDSEDPRKFSWDGMVGTSLHYEEVEGSGEWLEVDPRIVPSDEPGWDWEMRKSHWRFLVRNGGWFSAEKKGVGIGFRLERIAYLNIETKEYETIRTANYGTPTVEAVPLDNDLLPNPKGKLTWANLFPGVHFEIHVSGDRLHEEIKVSQAARDAMPAPPYPAADTYLVMVYEVDWGQVPGLADDDGDIDYDTDFERTARLYLKNHQGEIVTALPASRAWPEGEPVDENGEPIEIPLRKRFVKVGEKHYLLVGAPVLALNALPEGTIIFDPDIDVSVAASADDAMEVITTGAMLVDTTYHIMGSLGSWGHTGQRFTVTMPTGATINVGYLTWEATATDSQSFVGNLYGEEAASPAQFLVEDNNITDRLRTTAEVACGSAELGNWTSGNSYNSPSIVSILQELEDTYDYSSGAPMCLLHIYSSGIGHRQAASWDHATAAAPALHIEYTADGAEGVPRHMMHYARMRRAA